MARSIDFLELVVIHCAERSSSSTWAGMPVAFTWGIHTESEEVRQFFLSKLYETCSQGGQHVHAAPRSLLEGYFPTSWHPAACPGQAHRRLNINRLSSPARLPPHIIRHPLEVPTGGGADPQRAAQDRTLPGRRERGHGRPSMNHTPLIQESASAPFRTGKTSPKYPRFPGVHTRVWRPVYPRPVIWRYILSNQAF